MIKEWIGYSEERLMEIFHNDFYILNFRKMKKTAQSDGLFGEDFLWTSLMQIKN